MSAGRQQYMIFSDRSSRNVLFCCPFLCRFDHLQNRPQLPLTSTPYFSTFAYLPFIEIDILHAHFFELLIVFLFFLAAEYFDIFSIVSVLDFLNV